MKGNNFYGTVVEHIVAQLCPMCMLWFFFFPSNWINWVWFCGSLAGGGGCLMAIGGECKCFSIVFRILRFFWPSKDSVFVLSQCSCFLSSFLCSISSSTVSFFFLFFFFLPLINGVIPFWRSLLSLFYLHLSNYCDSFSFAWFSNPPSKPIDNFFVILRNWFVTQKLLWGYLLYQGFPP